MFTPRDLTPGDIRLTRRRFLVGTAAVAGTLTLYPKGLRAQTISYKFVHGDFEITVISDGELTLPASLIGPNADPAAREAAFRAANLDLETFRGQVNITLVRAGNDLILFDNGTGGAMGPTAGHLVDNLKATGIDPASVTRVVFTHGHPDHIWGTIGADGLRFPNATYHSAAVEWDFWNGANILSMMPADMHQMVTENQRQYAAVADRVQMFRPGEDIVTGITAIDTPGHTPGHVSFELAGGSGLIIMGDVLPDPRLYFPHPEWTFGFDADQALAVATRQRVLDRAATDRVTMIGYHWPFPGVGMAERDGTAYRYVPAT